TTQRVIDWVVANRQPISSDVARRYRSHGAEQVAIDLRSLQGLGYRAILDNLLEEHGVIRHNPSRLARLLLEEFLSPSSGRHCIPLRNLSPARGSHSTASLAYTFALGNQHEGPHSQSPPRTMAGKKRAYPSSLAAPIVGDRMGS